ncbi:polymorphic toxin-type HINT domain-containing protein [Variovorax sp. V15]|uniref:polymorphic toxin-type HINT domain-containing protein n=1 Tax=Variovorax sp. V15 TaxID=3065952 RepID=UPI0034E87C68
MHTKDGLKPIEDIKVGDYVLSSPEDGSGGQEYKRVLKTFVHEQKVIVGVQFTNVGAPSVLQGGDIYFVTTTENHPFWVEGVGWTRADALKGGDVVRKADGSLANVFGLKRIYRTSRDGVGWTFLGGDIKSKNRSLFWYQLGYDTYEEYFFAEEIGTLFDYANYDLTEDDGRDKYISPEVYHSEDPYLKIRVYNLEVEDFHTYYVDAQGFWVHHINCEGVHPSGG